MKSQTNLTILYKIRVIIDILIINILHSPYAYIKYVGYNVKNLHRLHECDF